MRETTRVDVVDSLDELLGVVSGDTLAEGPRVCDEVEKLTARNKLANDIGNFDLLSVLFVPNGAFIEFKIFEDVLVIKHVDRLNFVAE